MKKIVCFYSLGCGIGYGYLHRIPAQPDQVIKEGPAPVAPAETPLTSQNTQPVNPVMPQSKEGFASVAEIPSL